MKKKILHITHAPGGGVETYMVNAVNYLPDFKFFIITGSNEINDKVSEEVQILKFQFRRQPHFSDLRIFFRMLNSIKKINPDIIHCHSAKGGALGRIAGFLTYTKVIYTPHAFSYLGFKGFKRSFYFSIEYILKYFTDYLLACSEQEKNRALNDLKYPAQKVHVIQNSVDLNKYQYKKIVNVSTNKTIGMIGRLIYQKNPILFIQAAVSTHTQFPDFKFKLLGYGHLDFLKSEIDNLINQHNAYSYIEVLKWNSVKVQDFFNGIDILILPSRFEGLPFVLLEAMASGVPVIVSDVEGNNEIVKHGFNGLLFKDNNQDDLIEKLIMLSTNPLLYDTLRSNAYNYIKSNNSLNVFSKKLEKFYLSV